MVVYVRLTEVLVLEALMSHVGVLNRGVIVLVLVGGTQVFEPAGHGVVVVSHMKVLMSVGQSPVLMLAPVLPVTVLGHHHLLGFSDSRLKGHADWPYTYPLPPGPIAGGP
jgi:fatty acid desaturase